MANSRVIKWNATRSQHAPALCPVRAAPPAVPQVYAGHVTTLFCDDGGALRIFMIPKFPSWREIKRCPWTRLLDRLGKSWSSRQMVETFNESGKNGSGRASVVPDGILFSLFVFYFIPAAMHVAVFKEGFHSLAYESIWGNQLRSVETDWSNVLECNGRLEEMARHHCGGRGFPES